MFHACVFLERKMSLMSQEELMQQFNNIHGEDPTFDMMCKR